MQNAGGLQPLVTLSAEDAPFWETFDKLCAQGGLVLQQHYDMSNQGWCSYSQNALVPFVDYRGPFRLSASGFNFNKSLSFATVPRNTVGAGQRSEQLSFSFNVVAEPRLPLLGLGQPKITLAVDDQDQSLVPSHWGGTTNLPQRLFTAATGRRCSSRRCSWPARHQRPDGEAAPRERAVTLLAEQKPRSPSRKSWR